MSDPRELPPNDLEAEVAVVGSMLLDPKACRDAASILTREDFYSTSNAEAFAVLDLMAQDGEAIDPLTFHDHLKSTSINDPRTAYSPCSATVSARW